jgi:ribose transport system ATP-binding protein
MQGIRSRRHALRLGLAFLPADRKRQGLLLERTLVDNVVLGQQAVGSHLIFTPSSATKSAKSLIPAANIKTANIDVVVGTLSGGNQQKAMIGRWMGVKTKIMIFDEPTAGIDIASKFEIYNELRRLANSGVAVLVCSTDFQEVGQVADRVLVMRSGNVIGEIDGPSATERRLLEMEMSK